MSVNEHLKSSRNACVRSLLFFNSFQLEDNWFLSIGAGGECNSWLSGPGIISSSHDVSNVSEYIRESPDAEAFRISDFLQSECLTGMMYRAGIISFLQVFWEVVAEDFFICESLNDCYL